MNTISRLKVTVAISVLLSLGTAACGGSGSNKTAAKSSTATTPTTTSAAVPPAAPSAAKHHRTSTHAKPHAVSRHKQRVAKAKSHTTTTTTTHTATTPPPKTTTNAVIRTVPPLPKPRVSGSAGGMRAMLHGENHDPTVNKAWEYSVLATDAGGQPLSGTVATEFVYSGQIVGRETPASHALSKGRLNDNLTFPAAAVGQPLSVQVVVHTHLGSVTLDWPVEVRR